MSAIARWFNHIGIPVYGYDKTPSALTALLEKEGMQISYQDEVKALPEEVILHKDKTLIVRTPAVPKDSLLLNYFNSNDFQVKKRSEVLGMITSTMFTVAVAGTHGKTSTSSIIAHLLKSSGENVVAFLGGVTQNYESNLILNDDKEGEPSIVVVEADEYDRSFLKLHPNIAVVTSVDPDHLDIYGDDQSLKEGFGDFIRLINQEGSLYIEKNALEKLNSRPPIKTIRYGINSGEVHAENVKAGILSFEFDYVSPDQTIRELELNMPGFHNVENALAAVGVSLELGLSESAIREGLQSFKGVKRRFEIQHQDSERVYIDDYAHHPSEIRAFLESVKAIYPGKKVTAVFQPHLYSRTRDFAEDFSSSLSIADEVVLLDIYPARELPLEGVNSEMLLDKITSGEKSVQPKEGLLEYFESNIPEVLVTLGAGDIDRLVQPIKQWIKGHGK